MKSIDLTLPAPNEVEVSAFGRGFGEAIVVHLGSGTWACIDSCLNPSTRRPAALTYFSELDLVANEVVGLIAITHWDDDHSRGIGEVVRACPNANVACSAALRNEDILEFVISTESAGYGLGSGVDELRTVLRLCGSRGQHLIWAKANLQLHPQPPRRNSAIIALSPSEDAVQRSVESLIEAATNKKIGLQRRYTAPEEPNGASVAMSVRALETTVLLGADLEKSKNPKAGWDDVLRHSAPTTRASLVKVPHHGSVNAHHDGFWSELAEPQVVAILTGWAKGGRYLPTTADLKRLRTFSNEVFLAGRGGVRRVNLDSEKRAMFRKLHVEKVEELTGWGHVRARRQPDDQGWRVELGGDAVRV